MLQTDENTEMSTEMSVTVREEDKVYTVGDAIQEVGLGKFQYKLIFVVGLISVAGGLGSTGFALFPPLARCHLHLDSIEEAILTSSGLLGAAAGGVILGYIATKFGRRTELVILMVWTAYFGLLSAGSPNYGWLLLLRFLVGIGHGGTGQRLSILFEWTPTHTRMIGAGVLTACWNVGNFLEAVFIKVLIPTGTSKAWRYVLLTDAGMFFVALLFQSWLPESPYFLMAVGEKGNALQHLERMACENKKHLPPGRLVSEDQKDVIVRHSKGMGEEGEPLMPKPAKSKGTIWDLFEPAEMALTSALLTFAWLALSVAVVGCAILTEEIFQLRQSEKGKCVNHFHVISHKGGYKCETLKSQNYTPILIIFASEFPALILTYYSSTILGRRKAIALSFFLSGLFFGLLLVCPVSTAWTTFFLGGCRMSVTTSFSLMIIYTPEVYPTYARGLAVGASRAVYRVGSAGVPFISQVLLRQSVIASKSVHTALCLASGFLCLLLPIETKGRHLEE